MPARNTIRKGVAEIVVVSQVTKAEEILEPLGHLGVFSTKSNVVNKIDENLRLADTVSRSMLAGGFIVLPVMPNRFGHAGRRNRSPEDIWVLDAKESLSSNIYE